LEGKVALVTGAFGGLGLHFAQTLARAGCKVALAGRRVAEGEAVLADLRKQGGQGCVVALDVRDPASVGAAFETARQQLGPVQVVVNSAGIAT
ncbi:SDR family NAD(P)-dependent oxidoreductase, partial [Pseudomonas sp. GW460-13]|uniref:SDR family NAD(P)-dependent oxidoreductase n=1 Tax=Pseudomonas sp. GW460-13 TaxID=2070590 RepID=UPI000CBC376F